MDNDEPVETVVAVGVTESIAGGVIIEGIVGVTTGAVSCVGSVDDAVIVISEDVAVEITVEVANWVSVVDPTPVVVVPTKVVAVFCEPAILCITLAVLSWFVVVELFYVEVDTGVEKVFVETLTGKLSQVPASVCV